jgi:hypothetical protein
MDQVSSRVKGSTALNSSADQATLTCGPRFRIAGSSLHIRSQHQYHLVGRSIGVAPIYSSCVTYSLIAFSHCTDICIEKSRKTVRVKIPTLRMSYSHTPHQQKGVICQTNLPVWRSKTRSHHRSRPSPSSSGVMWLLPSSSCVQKSEDSSAIPIASCSVIRSAFCPAAHVSS